MYVACVTPAELWSVTSYTLMLATGSIWQPSLRTLAVADIGQGIFSDSTCVNAISPRDHAIVAQGHIFL